MQKSISKFSILFILAILIPGSVLTYFSIQNISSQRDLTEKRLLEEQNQLAMDLSEHFQETLLRCADSFFQDADSFSSSLISGMPILDSNNFVLQAFLVNREGKFLWPNYDENGRSVNTAEKSDEFLRSYSSAESLEFSHSDLDNALQFYQEAFNSAETDLESASAINAMARVSVKLDLFNRAVTQYRTLVDKYGSVIDESGIPFGYYALYQLIRLTSDSNNERILTDMDHILTQMIRGKIPLAAYTELLLENIETWFETLSPDMKRSHMNLNNKKERIGRLFLFILQDGNAIRQFLIEDQTHSSFTLGPYSAFVGNRYDQPDLILLDSQPANSTRVGFKVDLNYLINRLLDSAGEKLQEYDLQADIIPRGQQIETDISAYNTVMDLSPYTPSWQLWIRPRNPDTVSQYIVRQRWIYGIAIILLIAGMFLGMVLILRDISREKKLARLRSDFVSNVTHELKTPLTSIRMFAETMRLGRIKKKDIQQEYLSTIVSESERLTRLINTVLDFSKIEQGEKQYHMVSVNLSSIVENALAAMNYWLKEHGFKVSTAIHPDIEIHGDGDAMEQVVLNLINNAMKYSPDHKEISVRLWQKAGFIYLEVQDKGLGIPESKQSRIFDKYYRAHTEHEQDKGGSGLGLTVINHIVEAHGGRIELKSKANMGSTFTIILPNKEGALPEEGKQL